MKTIKLFSMVVLALIMAACSNDDNEIQQQVQPSGKMHFIATIAAPNSGTTTRTAYTESGTSINVVWKAKEDGVYEGDKIALVHNGVKDVATVTAVDGSGNATIEATITGSPTDGDDVVLVYPAVAVGTVTSGTTYTPDATTAGKVLTQDGTLTYIQNNLDFRQGAGKLAVGGSGASLKANVSMVSQIAIWKLLLRDDATSPNALGATAVTIKVGGTTKAAAASLGTSTFYFCLVPAQMGSGNLTIEATTPSGPYTYTKSGGVTLTAGTFYRSNVKMIPVGALSGKFTINSSGKQVHFSKGNLQATYNNEWSWAFAENQWDYIGDAAGNTSINGNGSVSANNVTVDLFGWVGASSTWSGAARWGISNSIASNSTNGYGNVKPESLKSDWGVTIGSNWRTLTSSEWTYLINTRTTGGTVFGTPQARYGSATINTGGTGVNGIILFPDGVDILLSEVTTPGTVNSGSNWETKCTVAQWNALAAKGCVFLPAAGDRYDGTSVRNVGSSGFYWSASSYTTVERAYAVYFSDTYLSPAIGSDRSSGFSVRLVHDL